MSFRIIDIDPHNSQKEILYKYLDFFDKLEMEQSPKDPLTPKDIQLQRMRGEMDGEVKIRKAILLERSDEIIANLALLYFAEESFEFEKNKHFVYLDINILKEFKESEAVRNLLITFVEVIKQNKLITVLESCSAFPRVWEFWEKIGAKLTTEEGRNRLYLDEVNWDLMEEWVNKGRVKAQEEEIELLSFKECPEEIIEDYAVLITELDKDVPFGDTAWTPSIRPPKSVRESEENNKEKGFGWWVLVTKEKDGTLSGMTDISFSPDTPYWIMQHLTGVKQVYRGRGLGKWLKAEMLFYIKENLPETIFIQTGNANFNAPMLSINDRMGFKKHLTEKCHKIKLEELEQNLK